MGSQLSQVRSEGVASLPLGLQNALCLGCNVLNSGKSLKRLCVEIMGLTPPGNPSVPSLHLLF